jgi:hypothetical protein
LPFAPAGQLGLCCGIVADGLDHLAELAQLGQLGGLPGRRVTAVIR